MEAQVTRLLSTPVRREPGILVTGSGRSGTGYLAEILNRCGLRAGHEAWWGLNTDGPEHGLDVDVSWLGCFDIGYTGRVFAQVRHPVDCIPSIYASEHSFPWLLVRAQNVHLTGDWAVDACRIWLDYTRHAVERAEAWWMVEDINPDLLAERFDLDAETVAAVLAEMPTDVNARPRADFTWPQHEVSIDVIEYAADLGYDVS